MANNCVNINSPAFKKLVSQVSMPPAILMAKISLWQDLNGVENFPTASEVSSFNTSTMKLPVSETKQEPAFFQSNAREVRKLAMQYGSNNQGFFSSQINPAILRPKLQQLGYSLKPTLTGSGYFITKNGKKYNPFSADYRQVSTVEERLPDSELDGKMKKIMHDLGIDLVDFREYKEWYEKKYKKPLRANAVADLLRKSIAVKEGSARMDTLPEEVGHFITIALKNDPRIQNALNNIESTSYWQQYSQEYIDAYDGDMDKVRMEIVGKMFTDSLINKAIGATPAEKSMLMKLWNAFKELFVFGNKAKERRIREGLDQIATEALEDSSRIKKELDKVTEKGAFFQLNPEDFNNSKIFAGMQKELKDSISAINKKIQLHTQRGTYVGKKKELRGKMLNALKENATTQGIIYFIENSEAEANQLIDRISAVRAGFEDGVYDENLGEFGGTMRDLKNYMEAYRPIVESLLSETKEHRNILMRQDPDSYDETGISKNIRIQQMDKVIESLNNIMGGMTTMKVNYEKYSKSIFIGSFRPFLERRFEGEPDADFKVNEMVNQLMENAESTNRDIPYIRRWFDSMAESTDDLLGLTDRLVKQHIEKAAFDLDYIMKDLLEADAKLKKSGIINTNFMYEMKDGVPTGFFITEFNQSKFNEEKDSFFSSLNSRYGMLVVPTNSNIDSIVSTIDNQIANIKSGKVKPFDVSEKNTAVKSVYDYIRNPKRSDSGSIEASVRFLENKKEYVKNNIGNNALKNQIVTANNAMKNNMDAAALNDYNQEIGQWFAANTDPNPKWKEIADIKKKDIYDRIVTEKRDKKQIAIQKAKAAEIYVEWFNERYIKDIMGTVTYRREFSTPKKSIYGNDTFAKMTTNQKTYYDSIIKLKNELTSHMPDDLAMSMLAPQIRKDLVERIKTDPKRALPEALRDALTRVADDTAFGSTRTDEAGNAIKEIPIFYTNSLENMSDLSMDTTANMIMFADMATRHKELSKVIDIVEIGRDVISERKIYSKNGVLESTGGRAAERYTDYMNMILYGELKNDEGAIIGVDVAKLADAIAKYTAINGLAFNVYSGISNVLLGNALIREEAFAKEYVVQEDLAFARKIYWQSKEGIMGLTGDIGKTESSNKLRLFLERFDVLQDHESRTREANTDRSRWGRMFDSSSIFFLNHVGEHQMQSRMALAMAHNKKVLDANGKAIPMYEAFEVKNNRLVVKDGIKSLNGKEFTIDDMIAFKLKTKAVNQRLHGIYNVTDRAAAQKKAVGRLGMLYRKWLKPGFNRRFENHYYNWSLEQDVEGGYITVAKFFKQLKDELKSDQYTFIAAKGVYNELPDWKKANIRRTLTEVGYFLVVTGLGGIMAGLAGDDDDNWALNMTAYQLSRLSTEIGIFVPVWQMTEVMKIVKSPSAAVNTIDSLLGIVDTINPSPFNDDPFVSIYKSGRRKGQLKLGVWTKKQVPFVNNIEMFFYPEERLKYFAN
jgi:uncharacterized protein YjiS (DUF1127 family)